MTAGQGRVVIVTGGGRGIGAAITRAFLDAGDRVAVLSRTPQEKRPASGRQIQVPCDVRRRDQVARAIDAVMGWGGRLDVLVNNAGKSGWRPMGDIDETFWTEMIDTNLSSTLFTCQAAAPHLGAGGAIVNISSLAGKRGSANNVAYCAAKFGVNGLTQSLAKELGPRGIRVNAICPVYVDTDGLREALQDPEAPPRGSDTTGYLRDFARTQAALQRLPTGEEVAAMCVMLSSAGASAITGQCINVDCGVLPQ